MRRYMPASIYDVSAVETWLSDLAKRGLLLDYMGETWGGFRRAEPRDCLYRLEPQALREYKPAGEKLEAYEAAGWEFVCASSGDDFFVYRSTRDNPEELHTDPVVQGYGYEWLAKRFPRKILLWLIVVAVGLGVWHLLLRAGHTSFLQIWVEMDPNVINLMWLLVVLLWGLWELLNDTLAFHRLLRTLRSGIPLTHRRKYGFRRRVRWVYLVIGVLYIICLFIVLLTGCFDPSPVGSSEPIPYVSLTQLGDSDGEPPPASITEYGPSLLGTARYEVGQGEWTGKYEGFFNSPSFHCQAETSFYRLRSGSLAWLLTRDLVRTGIARSGGKAEKLQTDVFDAAYYARDKEGVQHLVLRRGQDVLSARITAPEDLRDHLPEFAAAFDAVS